jgi:hypothetical protein
MQTRMARAGVGWADILAVIAFPAIVRQAKSGRVNAWGDAANGIRIRVTYHPSTRAIITVCLADSRYP